MGDTERAGPPAPSASFLLMALGRRTRDRVEQRLRAESVSLRHVSALGHLASSPGLSYSELARRAGVTPQSMQATIDALERRGAVTRVGDPGRGRTAELRVTAEGDRLRQVGRQAITEADDDVRAQLGPELHDTVLRALSELHRPDG